VTKITCDICGKELQPHKMTKIYPLGLYYEVCEKHERIINKLVDKINQMNKEIGKKKLLSELENLRTPKKGG